MFSNMLLNFILVEVLNASLLHIIRDRYGFTVLHLKLRSLLGTVERHEDVFGEGYFFCTVVVQYC